MDSQRRLSTLKRMLARLTGTEPETPQVSQVLETPKVSQVSPPDPNERKLQLLQSMLSKLQG